LEIAEKEILAKRTMVIFGWLEEGGQDMTGIGIGSEEDYSGKEVLHSKA